MRLTSAAATLFFLLTGVCAAQTRLEVQPGWGGVERADRWNPIILRISNPVPRDVIVEHVTASLDGSQSVEREHIAIGPSMATFEMFARLPAVPSKRVAVVLRDAQNGQTIAQFPRSLASSTPSPVSLQLTDALHVGISGEQAPLAALGSEGIAVTGYLPTRLLPRTPIGYDCIDVLFLNNVKLDEVDHEQQSAILSWVRAGGSLLLTLGDGPPPPQCELCDALPCRVGPLTQIDIDPTKLRASGLMDRFTHMTARALTRRSPDTREDQLIAGSGLIAWSGGLGFGRILVSPIDLSKLEFNPADEKTKSPAFWSPIFADLTGAPARSAGSNDQESNELRMFAISAGSPPRRSFSIGLFIVLIVVGPFDSIFLYAIGRRPLTWTTLPGWLGLIVAVVHYGMPMTQPDRVEFRSIRCIDQIDEQAVASSTLIGLSSSSDCEGSLEVPEDQSKTWWHAVTPAQIPRQQAHPQADAEFHASDFAALPTSIPLTPGSPRLLKSTTIQAAPPMFLVNLKMRPSSNGSPHLTGTIKNVSDHSLKDVRVRTQNGVVPLTMPSPGELRPQTELRIDLSAVGPPLPAQNGKGVPQPPDESTLWSIAPDLARERSRRVDELVESGDFAVAYAQVVDPPAPATFVGNGMVASRYYQSARAVVPLHR